MSNENANNNVNQSLQLDPEKLGKMVEGMEEVLAERRAAKEAKEKEAKRIALLGEIKKGFGESWNDINNAKGKDGKTLEEFLKSKPNLLDDIDLATEAVDIFKTRALNPIQKSDSAGASEDTVDPLRPNSGGGSSNGDKKIPDYGTPEFYEALSNGSLKESDIDKYNLREEDKYLLKSSIPKPTEVKEFNTFFK